MLSDSDFRFCLQQIDGRQRTRDKLPTFAAIDGWLYPPRLNLEQCSSERTARFKASLLHSLNNIHSSTAQLTNIHLIDATGGYGVDTFFMSEQAAQTHYFEQNTNLAAIAEHNFRLAGKHIHCHPEPFTPQSFESLLAQRSNSDSGLTAQRSNSVAVLYLDPARRDNHGGKVFRLEDCTPNVIEIIRSVREQEDPSNPFNPWAQISLIRILLKLSPMLDFHQAIAQLGGSWDVYVVSVNGEVKELLLLSDGSGEIHAVMLTDDGDHDFSYTPQQESGAEAQFMSTDERLEGMRVYEPDAALLKAGAFRLISARYGLKKADANTHLYFSNLQSPIFNLQSPISTLSGRWWQILGVYTRAKEVQRALTRANILTRNYTLPADALRKQLRLKDGGDDYIIGCRLADRPLLLHCRRIEPVTNCHQL